MREFGILEMVRTGRVAMMRDKTITEEVNADSITGLATPVVQ